MNNTYECPFCGSVIKKNAKKCPYCKSVLSSDGNQSGHRNIGSFLRTGILYAISILIVLGAATVGINFYTKHGDELRNEEYERILLDAENHYLSREDFIRKLEDITFSRDEANKLADECGIDWNEQAVLYLKNTEMTHSENNRPLLPEEEMFDYLVNSRHFSKEEAQYAIDTVYN
ncbi:MAG: hypothetical protein E7218_00970 [Anaerofustis stercorihominis]|nr:hypothetical protein [Anaerofustis stercorihominis]